jgi:hypothetical protein
MLGTRILSNIFRAINSNYDIKQILRREIISNSIDHIDI